MDCEVLHFQMEMKYLCPNSSETMVLPTSVTVVQIRRSWHKYYSFKTKGFGNLFKQCIYSVKKQKNEMPLNHLRFIKTLVDRLRGDIRQPRDRASTSTANYDEIRLNGKLRVILTGTKKYCKVCSYRNEAGEDTKQLIIAILFSTSQGCLADVL